MAKGLRCSKYSTLIHEVENSYMEYIRKCANLNAKIRKTYKQTFKKLQNAVEEDLRTATYVTSKTSEILRTLLFDAIDWVKIENEFFLKA